MVNTWVYVCVCAFFHSGYSARILGFFVLPSFSHQIFFQAIWKELALKGHHVTVVSPNILNDSTITNAKEIHVPKAYDVYKKMDPSQSLSYGAVHLKWTSNFPDLTRISNEFILDDVKVQELIASDERFDLLLVQAMNPLALAIAARFRAPIVGESFYYQLVYLIHFQIL